MTSNIGTQDALKKTIGFNSADNSDEIISESIKKFLAPEFRSRIDSIIQFSKLQKNDMIKIVSNKINDLNKQLEENNMEVTLDDNVLDYIADKSYKSELGARYIQNVIQKDITTKLARLLLEDSSSDEVKHKQIVLENGNIKVI